MSETRAAVKERPRYTFRKKIKAFVRGLPKMRPFMEVAEEGLRRGYSLTKKEENKYTDKILFSEEGDVQVVRLFREGVTKEAQDQLAMDLILRTGFLSIYSVMCGGDKETHRKTVDKLSVLLDKIADALFEGRVTSPKAQKLLIECFIGKLGNRDYFGKYRMMLLSPDSHAGDIFRKKARERFRETGSGPSVA